jgi:hypothetical protein
LIFIEYWQKYDTEAEMIEKRRSHHHMLTRFLTLPINLLINQEDLNTNINAKEVKRSINKTKNRHIVEFKIIHSIMDKDLLIIILSKKCNIP